MMICTKQPGKMFSMFVLAGGVMLAGMIGQAQAGDKKIYNAALCQPRQGSDDKTLYSYVNGSIINNDPRQPFHIECPVTRDEMKKGIKKWSVIGSNMSKGDIRCTMYSRRYPEGSVIDRQTLPMKKNRLGRINQVSNWQKRLKVLTELKKARFGQRVRRVASGKTYFTLSCSLPPKNGSNGIATIFSYEVIED